MYKAPRYKEKYPCRFCGGKGFQTMEFTNGLESSLELYEKKYEEGKLKLDEYCHRHENEGDITKRKKYLLLCKRVEIYRKNREEALKILSQETSLTTSKLPENSSITI